MSEDSIWAISIGVVVLMFSVYIIRNAAIEQRHLRTTRKRTKGLAENRVHLGPPDEVIADIAKLLNANGQTVTVDEIDNLVYEDEDTWVIYAYGRNVDSLQGVLIASKVGSQMQIRNYGLVVGVDEPKVRQRLARGLAWEARQVGADKPPAFRGSSVEFEKQLETDLREAYRDYRHEEVIDIF